MSDYGLREERPGRGRRLVQERRRRRDWRAARRACCCVWCLCWPSRGAESWPHMMVVPALLDWVQHSSSTATLPGVCRARDETRE